MSRIPRILRPTPRRAVREISTESDYPVTIAVGKSVAEVNQCVTIPRNALGLVLTAAKELDHYAVAIISLHGSFIIENRDARRIAKQLDEMLKTSGDPTLIEHVTLLKQAFSMAESESELKLFVAAG